ncbi:hypothetical protein [Natranaerobius thermophilus]|uniref:Uncharacterized protein n=1 Tax=Natranaerobius thermophilus (strain ATCC BAA-1301 / DSM 18059 / JW/NM-WN-LF) TaxID=457570 RepID=B2A8N5_NATTJ|nr:hypothetical protein [Natranaerobius thermophilus]ACB86484.1 hypothetical protein Nther_2939 [Natranaerobius thermophilus JW/NM-WN-LF]
MKIIKEKAELYKQSREEVNRKIEVWENEIFDLVENKLQEIVSEIGSIEGLKVTVGESPMARSVRLTFGVGPYGKVDDEAFIKRGGSLLFIPKLNGGILVSTSSPSIESDERILVEEEKKPLENYNDPNKITEDKVEKHVEEFFDDLINWWDTL